MPLEFFKRPSQHQPSQYEARACTVEVRNGQIVLNCDGFGNPISRVFPASAAACFISTTPDGKVVIDCDARPNVISRVKSGMYD